MLHLIIGETEEVRALMANGAPFTADWLGTSPLHMAAASGHVETCEVTYFGTVIFFQACSTPFIDLINLW